MTQNKANATFASRRLPPLIRKDVERPKAKQAGISVASGARNAPFRYSINVTLDGCCDRCEMLPDEDLHRHAVENLVQADALLFGRVMPIPGYKP